MTEKLYYTDGHLSRFEALVCSCEREGDGYAVRLDRTAFFPGGGDRRPTGGPSRDRSCSHCARRARISYTLLKNLSRPARP